MSFEKIHSRTFCFAVLQQIWLQRLGSVVVPFHMVYTPRLELGTAVKSKELSIWENNTKPENIRLHIQIRINLFVRTRLFRQTATVCIFVAWCLLMWQFSLCLNKNRLLILQDRVVFGWWGAVHQHKVGERWPCYNKHTDIKSSIMQTWQKFVFLLSVPYPSSFSPQQHDWHWRVHTHTHTHAHVRTRG